MDRDPEAMEALEVAMEHLPRYMGSEYHRHYEYRLAEVYRDVLSAEEAVRWRETWLDVVLKDGRSGPGVALAMAKDKLAAETLLTWIDEDRLPPDASSEILRAYLDLPYLPAAAATKRFAARHPDAWGVEYALGKAEELDAMGDGSSHSP